MQKQDKLDAELSDKASTTEPRTAERFATVRDVSSRPAAECQEILIVWVRDLSTHGIGLLSWGRFEKAVLLLQFLENYSSISPLMAAKVVQVKAQATGDWLIGCALVRGLTEAEVQRLVKHGPAKKRRSRVS
jgi:hypothetical protein